jgi:hypothetical protein
MSRPVVDSVRRSLPVGISEEEGGSAGAGGSGSMFRLLLDLEARLRKQRREESKMAFGRRRIFLGDQIG